MQSTTMPSVNLMEVTAVQDWMKSASFATVSGATVMRPEMTRARMSPVKLQ